MEYADSGDLRAYLEKNFSSLDWDKKCQLAFDITKGVRYLHMENIIHRDLVCFLLCNFLHYLLNTKYLVFFSMQKT